MLILASASDKLQLITSAAGNINVHASYLDNVAGTVAPGRQNVNITTAATTDIVPSPASGTFRNLKTLHIYNVGPSNQTVIIQHTDGTTVVQIHETLLQPGQDLQYRDEAGFAFLFGNSLWSTGDLKPTHKATADVSWIMWVDGTIGDGTSGSSIMSDIATTALFALYYNNCTDTDCPLLTAAGAATTRAAQGTAAAAYAAHCRMTMPKAAGRALALSGTGAGLTARALGSNIGVEAQNPSVATMASHNHPSHDALGGLDRMRALAQYDTIATYNNFNWTGGPNSLSIIDYASVGDGQPFPIMQPTTYVNVMVKL
jgi:hypothetical protein